MIAKLFSEIRKVYKAWDLRLKFGKPKLFLPEFVPHIDLHEGSGEEAFKRAIEEAEKFWEGVKMDDLDYPVSYRRGRVTINPDMISSREEAWYYLLIGFFKHKILRKLNKELRPYEEVLVDIYSHAEAMKRLRMGTPLQGNPIEMAALRSLATKESLSNRDFTLALLEPSENTLLLFGSPPIEISMKLDKLIEGNDASLKKLAAFTLLVDSPKNLSFLP